MVHSLLHRAETPFENKDVSSYVRSSPWKQVVSPFVMYFSVLFSSGRNGPLRKKHEKVMYFKYIIISADFARVIVLNVNVKSGYYSCARLTRIMHDLRVIPGTVSKRERYGEPWSRGRAPDSIKGTDGGSIPPTAISKLSQFRSPHICLCLSEETLKAFYLVSMPVKDPTHGDKCVACSGLTNSREGQLPR